MKTLLLIDGNPILHRSYHALPLLTTKTGFPTNVVYGFFSILNKLTDTFKPDYLATVFDTPKPTFRNKLYIQYQAQRPKIEDNFAKQIPVVKEAIKLADIFTIEKDGYEADDLIGSISEIFSKQKDYRIIIVSGDKDILQLVKKNVFVATPIMGLNLKIYNQEEVVKKLEVLPEQIPDFKGLAGDPSDNYPGAKGIGPKTAVKLINQFKNIENIYEHLNQIESKKIREILLQEKENVFLSKKLATIIVDVPVKIDINKMENKGFSKKLKDFFEEYEIYSLIKRFFPEKKPAEKKEDKNDGQIGLF